jgi:hypothetical protein
MKGERLHGTDPRERPVSGAHPSEPFPERGKQDVEGRPPGGAAQARGGRSRGEGASCPWQAGGLTEET